MTWPKRFLRHPTIGEAIKEAAEDALGMGLHLPPRKIIRMPVGV